MEGCSRAPTLEVSLEIPPIGPPYGVVGGEYAAWGKGDRGGDEPQ